MNSNRGTTGKAMDEPVRWVTKAEAAEELGVSLSTLDRRIRVERSRWSGRDAGSECVCTVRSIQATGNCCAGP